MNHATRTTIATSQSRTDGRFRRLAAVGLGVFTALHGIAHFVGAATHLEQADAGIAGEYLGGMWSVSDPGVLRALAVVWTVIGAAFVVAGVLVVLRHRLARPSFITITAASLALTVLASWAAVIGVVVNAPLLALALTPATAAWFFDEHRWPAIRIESTDVSTDPDRDVDRVTQRDTTPNRRKPNQH